MYVCSINISRESETSMEMYSSFLNQACAGAWFLEITSVWMYVCVCVCLSVSVRLCVRPRGHE